MAWFGAAHSVARETKESSELGDSMSEGDKEGDKDGHSRMKYQKFHDTNLSFGRRLKLCTWMRFRDLNLFESVFQQFCIQNGFAYSYVKSDQSRVTAKCKSQNCN